MTGAFVGARLFGYSLAVGVLLGVVYDILRIRRIATAPTGTFGQAFTPVPLAAWEQRPPKRNRAGTILLFLEDILFALFAATPSEASVRAKSASRRFAAAVSGLSAAKSAVLPAFARTCWFASPRRLQCSSANTLQ